MYLDEEGHFTDEDLAKIDEKTKIVAFAAVSNVLGMKRPIEKIIEKAHAVGAIAVLDGAQSAPHMKSDVQKWDCDFYAFSEQVPFKFEAGTENVEGAVALHAAIDYLEDLGFDEIERHEYELTKHCLEGLMKLPYVHILGSKDP